MARTKTRLRRPGETGPPKMLSDEELAAMRPDQVEAALVEHEGFADRLAAAPDPGQGLPRAEAEAERTRQLRQLEAHTAQAERLRTAYEAIPSGDVERERALWQRVRRGGLQKAAAEMASPEEKERLRRLVEESKARERERKARERLEALKERRRNPAHPDAAELVGAVAMEQALLEALEVKLRPDGKGGYSATHLLEPLELGVLLTCLNLLRELGSVEVSGMGSSARWPRREPPLVPVEGLRDALFQLRRQGWLAFRVESDVARVRYGERVREVAQRWGIELESGPEKVAATTA